MKRRMIYYFFSEIAKGKLNDEVFYKGATRKWNEEPGG